ncbi:MAG: GreA/GreB family elongation factor [Flavobacteriales bacterium]|nr:GreA/GreB family elongation factor [Flavobacteriales bacterium]
MKHIKERLHSHCMQYATARIERIRQEITEAQVAANEEVKSSAGDKHETGRAMAQLEVEKNAQLLHEAEKLKAVMETIPANRTSETVTPGSLVITSDGVFYIAISIGKAEVEGMPYLIISAESPIGMALSGKKKGDEITWNNRRYVIEEVR